MLAELIPLKGGPNIRVSRDITIVGRDDAICDMILQKSSISKLHCLIVKTDGLLFIRDLGSTNGTKVNGQRVIRGALLPGDELSFANEKFKVQLGPDRPGEINEDHAQTDVIPVVNFDNGDTFGAPADPSPPRSAKGGQPAAAGAGARDPNKSDSDVRLLRDDEL